MFHYFQEDVAKAGGKERTLYRNMRKLESETRKQEQICNSKKALMETVSNSARKQAQDQLRAVNSHQKEVGQDIHIYDLTQRFTECICFSAISISYKVHGEHHDSR